MKKTLKIYTLLQAALWIPLLLSDFAEETDIFDENISILIGLPAGILAGVLFLRNEPLLRETLGLRRVLPHFFAAAGLWAAECFVFGCLGMFLLDMDIIPQNGGGFLDGIEYLAFPFLNGISAVCIAMVGLLGKAAFRKYRAYKQGNLYKT